MGRTTGIVMASAAAGLILAGAIGARADEQKTGGEMVMCAGINSCKGQGVCAGPESSCAGMNSCKGKGVIKSTAEECKKKGGKVVESKM